VDLSALIVVHRFSCRLDRRRSAQLVEEDTFVATLAPRTDPAVQKMIIDETTAAITDQVDFAAITSTAIDGIVARLPPAAASALSPSRSRRRTASKPGRSRRDAGRDLGRIRSDVGDGDARRAPSRPRRRRTAESRRPRTDGVGIQLGAIVDAVKQHLTAQGVRVAGLIPPVDRVVILGTGETLAMIRTAHAVAAAVGYWPPSTPGLSPGSSSRADVRRRAGCRARLLIGGAHCDRDRDRCGPDDDRRHSDRARAVRPSPRSTRRSLTGWRTSAIVALVGAVVAVLAWTRAVAGGDRTPAASSAR
jgi:hypothetical protein